MSESDESEEKALITLPLDEGPKDFDDIGELSEWAKNQRDSLSWLQKAVKNQGNIQQAWNVLNNSIQQVENFCNRYPQQNEPQRRAEAQNVVKHFTNVVNAGHILTTGSADLAFIDSVRKEHSDIIAAYAYAFLAKHDFQIASSAAFAGAHLAMRYQLGSSDTVKAEKKALESTKRSWAVKFGKFHKKLQSDSDALIKDIEERQSSFNELISDLNQQTSDQKESFDAICSDGKKELESIAETYDQKLALQSSVSYWRTKKRSHSWAMWATGVVSILSGAATAVGFISVAYIFLQGDWSQVEVWRFGVLVAISTFGIWLTRLFGKIFVANLHLRTDAQERETMILTYLAMLREGDVLKSDERELILQVVFRPGTSGYIKEDGPGGFGDLISALLKR